MKDLVRKFYKPGDVVMKLCAGTCGKAKACLVLDQRRTFVECDVDSELQTAAEASLSLSLSRQVPNRKYNIIARAEVKIAANVSKDDKTALPGTKKVSVWEVLPMLDATQILPGHSLQPVSAMFQVCFLYEMRRRLRH